MKTPLPQTMRVLSLKSYDGRPDSLQMVERPIPRLTAGQVLVKVAAAPINPSDLMFVRGLYGVKKPLPTVPGFEGSGTVVAAGSVAGQLLVGRRVACVASPSGDGTWAEYVAVPLPQCLPLRGHIDNEQGASLFVNPFTAWALMDIAAKGGHTALAQTAASSSLGRMLLKLAQRKKVPMVHIVRKAENEELLRRMGAQHVVNSSEPEFEERLRLLFNELGVTLAFDAVAGRTTGQVLHAMPAGGTVMVYGGLSEQECRVAPHDLIFGRKKVEGFWLSDWMRRGFGKDQLRALVEVPSLVGRQFETPIRARLPLESAGEAVRIASADMTAGKVLFVPSAA
ncbi:zinc-binding dehydrogenase [Myxococcaceae bacterium GXIMD 01537]